MSNARPLALAATMLALSGPCSPSQVTRARTGAEDEVIPIPKVASVAPWLRQPPPRVDRTLRRATDRSPVFPKHRSETRARSPVDACARVRTGV
jgi:hypothetical protein